MESAQDSDKILVKHPSRTKEILILLFVFVCLIIGIFLFLRTNSLQHSIVTSENDTSEFWYPFIAKSSQKNENVLFFYSNKDNKYLESDFPSDGVLVSPDRKVSVASALSGDFYLIQNTYPDFNPRQILQLKGKRSSWIQWAPNSQKFLYYFWDDTGTKTYAIYDITNNSNSLLELPKQQYESLYFKDNDNLLVKEETSPGMVGDDVYVFNLLTGQKSEPIVFKNFYSEFIFLSNGLKWLISKGDTEPKPGSGFLILADFPDTNGVVVDSGSWAELQPSIFISPQERYIAYERDYDGIFTWIYDITQGIKKKFIEGRPLAWIDDNTILVQDFSKDDGLLSVATLDGKNITLRSDFFNSYPLKDGNEKGILYTTSTLDGYAIRFFDFSSKKSKTVLIRNEYSDHSQWVNQKIYYLLPEGKLWEFDPYLQQEKVIYDFATVVNIEKERVHDFKISGRDLLYIVCSYEEGCLARVVDLASKQVKSSHKIRGGIDEGFYGYEMAIQSYDSQSEIVQLSLNEALDDCCTSKITKFDFNLKTEESNKLYVETCFASEDENDPGGCEVNEGVENYKKINPGYNICDDLKVQKLNDDKDLKLSGAEVVDLFIPSAQYFGCVE